MGRILSNDDAYPRPGVAWWMLLGGSLTWLSALGAAPLARFLGWSGSPLLYAFFSPLCHQIPERSFFWLGSPLAVCHRCFGLYLGFLLGLLIFRCWTAPGRILLNRPRLLLLFWIPLGINVLSENTPWGRWGTGVVAALPVAFFLWLALDQVLCQGETRRKGVWNERRL